MRLNVIHASEIFCKNQCVCVSGCVVCCCVCAFFPCVCVWSCVCGCVIVCVCVEQYFLKVYFSSTF